VSLLHSLCHCFTHCVTASLTPSLLNRLRWSNNESSQGNSLAHSLTTSVHLYTCTSCTSLFTQCIRLSPTRLDLAYHCLLSSTYKVSVSRNRVISCRRDYFLMNWRPGRGPSNRQNTFTTSFKKAASQKKTPHLALKVTHEHLQA
jgi:hypothetical protein